MNERRISSVVQPMMSCSVVVAVTTPSEFLSSRCTCPARKPATTNGECVVANICKPGKVFEQRGNYAPLPRWVEVVLDLVYEKDGGLRLFQPSANS